MASVLRVERVKRDLSQYQLGVRAGIPQWRMSLIERGIAPTDYEREKIAQVLGVDPGSLFPGSDVGGGK